MQSLRLKRIASTPHGVFGVLLGADGIPLAVTLEDPWVENLAGESCIPALTYICQRVQSPHFGETFEVTNVPDRTHILFHRGNTTLDTKGCILVGEQFGLLNGVPAILASGPGHQAFMAALTGEPTFQLLITWS